MTAVARVLVALGQLAERDRAIVAVRYISELSASKLPPWWRWTAHLAAAITVRRIEAV